MQKVLSREGVMILLQPFAILDCFVLRYYEIADRVDSRLVSGTSPNFAWLEFVLKYYC
jgi:hypothetical protein